jgi:thioesterase domain-containing protein
VTPVVFLLPGLIDDDPEFEEHWDPLRKAIPLVRVSYLDWTELVKPGSSFSDIVTHVRWQIENLSPDRPLLIVGYSVGGCIAYACTLALESAGRSVRYVTIIDAPAKMEWSSLPLGKRIRNRIRSLLKPDLRGAAASVFAKILTSDHGRPVLRRLSRFRNTRLPLNFDWYLHRKLTMQMELRLLPSWWQETMLLSSRLSTPILVFRSADYDAIKDESLGWNSYSSDCKTIRVAGEHGSMLHAENSGTIFSSIVNLMN